MINDAVQIELKAHVDDRGYLVEIIRAKDEHFTKFGQVYLVGNFGQGTIRAFHKHEVLWDWFFISHGSAKFVLRDDRKDSSTHGYLCYIFSKPKPSCRSSWCLSWMDFS